MSTRWQKVFVFFPFWVLHGILGVYRVLILDESLFLLPPCIFISLLQGRNGQQGPPGLPGVDGSDVRS